MCSTFVLRFSLSLPFFFFFFFFRRIFIVYYGNQKEKKLGWFNRERPRFHHFLLNLQNIMVPLFSGRNLTLDLLLSYNKLFFFFFFFFFLKN